MFQHISVLLLLLPIESSTTSLQSDSIIEGMQFVCWATWNPKITASASMFATSPLKKTFCTAAATISPFWVFNYYPQSCLWLRNLDNCVHIHFESVSWRGLPILLAILMTRQTLSTWTFNSSVRLHNSSCPCCCHCWIFFLSFYHKAVSCIPDGPANRNYLLHIFFLSLLCHLLQHA